MDNFEKFMVGCKFFVHAQVQTTSTNFQHTGHYNPTLIIGLWHCQTYVDMKNLVTLPADGPTEQQE